MGVECLPHRALLAVQLSLHVPFGISGRFPLRRVYSPRVRFWNDSPGGQLAVGWRLHCSPARTAPSFGPAPLPLHVALAEIRDLKAFPTAPREFSARSP